MNSLDKMLTEAIRYDQRIADNINQNFKEYSQVGVTGNTDSSSDGNVEEKSTGIVSEENK
jgi:hypothetical protein